MDQISSLEPKPDMPAALEPEPDIGLSGSGSSGSGPIFRCPNRTYSCEIPNRTSPCPVRAPYSGAQTGHRRFGAKTCPVRAPYSGARTGWWGCEVRFGLLFPEPEPDIALFTGAQTGHRTSGSSSKKYKKSFTPPKRAQPGLRMSRYLLLRFAPCLLQVSVCVAALLPFLPCLS